MNIFNSLTDVTDAVANSINNGFILIVDHCGEYTPDTWNYIEVDSGISNPDTNPLSKLHPAVISSIQAWEQDECISHLIFIPLTKEDLTKHYQELYKIIQDIAKTEDSLGDDDYFDYIPEAFDILEQILFGLAHTYDDPTCAFDALKVSYNHYDLIKAYAKFSSNTYNSDDILSLTSPHSFSQLNSFTEEVQIRLSYLS